MTVFQVYLSCSQMTFSDLKIFSVEVVFLSWVFCDVCAKSLIFNGNFHLRKLDCGNMIFDVKAS